MYQRPEYPGILRFNRKCPYCRIPGNISTSSTVYRCSTPGALLRKPLFVLSAALLCVPAHAQSASSRRLAASGRPDRAPRESAQLPVTRVAFYKNGVGFFEHSGRVTGDQTVIIDFTSAQLNDVLQSLTAIDLGGGRISGAGYNSTTPLDQQLKLLPLALGETPTSIDFYNAVRGARVEVHSPAGILAGRLLSFEVRTTEAPKDAMPPTEKHFITIASDSGDIRTFELTPATDRSPPRQRLSAPISAAISSFSTQTAAKASATSRCSIAVTGTRDLRVSYLSEVPIWKSTYRILFTDAPTASTTTQTATLQGWSVDRQHHRGRLEQRPAFVDRRLPAELHPAALATDLHASPRDPYRSGCAADAADPRIGQMPLRHGRLGAWPACRACPGAARVVSPAGWLKGKAWAWDPAPAAIPAEARIVSEADALLPRFPCPTRHPPPTPSHPTPPPQPSTTTSLTTSPTRSPSARTSPPSSPSSRPRSSPSASPSGIRSSPSPSVLSGSPTPPT